MEIDIITIIQFAVMFMSIGAFFVYLDETKRPNKMILAVLVLISALMFILLFGPEFQRMTEIVNT